MKTARPAALIADDEPLLRSTLKRLLGTAWPELQVVAEARNGREALEEFETKKPGVCFLDIHMPGITGVDAARAIGRRAHIVFVTAYDQYAVRAFEQGAVDYLLKPVDPERVALACRRLRERLQEKPEPMSDLLEQLSQRLGGAGLQPRESLRWVQASVGANIRMIPTAEILFFRAEDKYTRVQTATFEALIRKPIKELIDELDPNEFWQIHRATVVRVDAIEQVSRNFRGQQIVHVKGSPDRLEVSRTFNHLFKQM